MGWENVQKARLMKANHLPFVSILIPVRNEVAYIERCLEAVIDQDYPQDRMEILIADGLSDDGTRELIEQAKSTYPQIQLFDNPQKIVPTGLNILIQQSKGEILIRVDGHCVIAQNYVRNCVRHILEDQVDGVGGSMHSIGEDQVSQVIALAMSSKFGVGGSSFRTETGHTKLVDTVPFPAYTRDIVEKVGLYDEELMRDQDDEYNYRIRKADGKILLAEDVHSTYYSRGSLKKLWHQYFQYGYWKVRVLQKHPRQMSLRQFIPPAFVSALLLGVFLSFCFPWGWIFFLGLIGLYLLANFASSFLIARREGLHYFWLLPFAFATIHISYGLGFLAGLVKFWNRWKDKSTKSQTIR